MAYADAAGAAHSPTPLAHSRLGSTSPPTAALTPVLSPPRAQVAIWRCRGRLPLSVDLTAALVEVQLRDSAYTAPEQPAGRSGPFPGASEAELRLLYSMAAIRVVNGVTDTSQKVRSTDLPASHRIFRRVLRSHASRTC